MLPYYLLLLFACSLIYFQQKSYAEKTKTILWWTTCIILVLFAGLRSYKVGTDSGGYARSFMMGMMWSVKNYNSLWERLTDEPGYNYLMQLASYLGDNYWSLFTLVAALSIVPIFYIVKKNSPNTLISIFVYICLGYYTFCFNAARQGIAVGILYLGLSYLFEKKFWKYAICVLTAALFHKTVIIALPAYFVFIRKFNVKQVLILIILGITVALLLPRLLLYGSTLESRYALYLKSNSTGGGQLLTLFYTILPFFFYYGRKFIITQYLRRYDVILQMLIIGSIIYLVVNLMGAYIELTRFAAYFQVSCIFLWAEVYMHSWKKPGLTTTILFVLGHLVFFGIFLSKMANLVPYMLNSSIFGSYFINI